jgi:hypothetical protein
MKTWAMRSRRTFQVLPVTFCLSVHSSCKREQKLSLGKVIPKSENI